MVVYGRFSLRATTALVGTDADDPRQQALRHLARKARALAERAADAGVLIPDVVGHLASRVGPLVAVFLLPIRNDAHHFIVECKTLRISYEIENVRVRACKLASQLLAEGVMPDDPVAHCQSAVVGDQLDVGGVLVTDGDVEGSVRLEHTGALADPVPRPGEIVVAGLLVVVLVVFIADIERWIGEDQVCKGLFRPP